MMHLQPPVNEPLVQQVGITRKNCSNEQRRKGSPFSYCKLLYFLVVVVVRKCYTADKKAAYYLCFLIFTSLNNNNNSNHGS